MCIGACEPGLLPRSSEPCCLHFEGVGDRDSDTRAPGPWICGGTRARGRGLPRADGLQRGRLPGAGRGAAGPSADAEEPDRGAAAGCPRRTRRPSSSSPRRSSPKPSPRRCFAPDSRRSARSRSGPTTATCNWVAVMGSATTTTASRPTRAGPRTNARPRPPTSSSRCASRRPRLPGARSSTGPCFPAEAGLDETHVSFTKGCYPGQEPIARLHYRGRPNRRLRVLEVEAASPGDEILLGEKAVGRVTSAVPGRGARLRQAGSSR